MKTFESFLNKKESICVVGLGYVGLPLTILLAKKYSVIGLDINSHRIDQLNDNYDHTNEISQSELKNTKAIFTSNLEKINEASFIIVTVPTPIDRQKKPDLNPIFKATKSIAKNLKKETVIVYESTVYPGLTEEECAPIIERISGLKWKNDFFLGYSPERINPGDKEHTIDKITKVVSGDTKKSAELISKIYGEVITAGIHQAPNIKTAEAAKVIENTQRDLNISLMNELSIIFSKLNINTNQVIEAAGTKWNFLKFTPGLVGGHCIGVDPYYLTHKAESIGYTPQVILSGRKINDEMGVYIANRAIKEMVRTKKNLHSGKILIAGFTFKEDVNDIRNTKVVDIYNELSSYGIEVDIFDPVASPDDVKREYGIEITSKISESSKYECVFVAVKHKTFSEEFTLDFCKQISCSKQPILVDIKNLFSPIEAENKGFIYLGL